MSINYFCSGFDDKEAFWPELAERFRQDMKDTKSIVYIPGDPGKLEETRLKYMPDFTEHLKRSGIIFDEIRLINTNMEIRDAKKAIDDASFVVLMGGDPFLQKAFCERLDILENLKNYNGVMLGISAGAMLMSKYIIITPCSEEYPDFHIESGLDRSGISIYPHNNFIGDEYPEKVYVGDMIFDRNDLIQVARRFGCFYLLQDHLNEEKTDVSLIRVCDGEQEFITSNNGKIFASTEDGIHLLNTDKKHKRLAFYRR